MNVYSRPPRLADRLAGWLAGELNFFSLSCAKSQMHACAKRRNEERMQNKKKRSLKNGTVTLFETVPIDNIRR